MFRFSRPEASGFSAARQALGKRCPRCGLGHRLASTHCDRCGHAFRTVVPDRPCSFARASAHSRKRRTWSIACAAVLAVLVFWLAACLLLTRGQSDFQFACACYGQDQARHELGGGGDQAGRAARWTAYARSHFMASSSAFAGGERVMLYDQSRGNVLAAYVVMRRAGAGWQRLPDDAGLYPTPPR